MSDIQPNDIVQITDEEHHWFPCLVVVTEVKKWGVQGYISWPEDNRGSVVNAFIRLPWEVCEKVGTAVVYMREGGE